MFPEPPQALQVLVLQKVSQMKMYIGIWLLSWLPWMIVGSLVVKESGEDDLIIGAWMGWVATGVILIGVNLTFF